MMDEITLREDVRPDDPAAVRRITESSGFFYPEEIDIAVELVDERLAKGLSSGYYFAFAERDGRALGYACFGSIPCTKSSWDLYWIAVEEGRRGGGVGRLLLERSEARVRELGGTRLYIETSARPLYEPTRAFYLRTGYRVDAVLEDFYGPGDGKFIFVKAL